MSKQFSNLEAWKWAKSLSVYVYSITKKYPSNEQFALTSQTTRAVVSIVANIAEGSSRSSNKDFAHFLEISIGSAFELETLIEIACDLHYIDQTEKKEFDDRIDKVLKLTFGLKRKLS
jgi:four helix bundle protein